MIDIDALDARIKPMLDSKTPIMVTKGWMMAVVREIRNDRATIVRLTAEIESRNNSGQSERVDARKEPRTKKEDLTEAMGAMDGIFSTIFGKRRK